MYYPVFFKLPGFFILGYLMLQLALIFPPYSILFPIAFIFAANFGNSVWMGVVVAGLLTLNAFVGHNNALEWACCGLLGWVLDSLGNAALCPRCQCPITPQRRGFGKYTPSDEWCPACGRTRLDVKLFQYLTKPEPWDGEYHDCGGGLCEKNYMRDWARSVLFNRIVKRQLKKNKP